MSKLETPREKKLASLALDRRNVYGENDKSSRKNISRSKQRGHRAERRASQAPLRALDGELGLASADAAELLSRDQAISQRRKSFKKKADVPLRTFIERQNLSPASRSPKRQTEIASEAAETR